MAAWAVALAVALVVLGYCGYELFWKARRLRADLRQLQELAGRTQQLREVLTVIQDRVAATGLR